MKILIDNGHGINTPGHRSPDGRVQEARIVRRLANYIVTGLCNKSLDAILLVPELEDIPLYQRVQRANKFHAQDRDCLLVSLHTNAYGNDWNNAHGWSVFAGTKASKNSLLMASIIANNAEQMGFYVRKPLPTQSYWQSNFQILNGTTCPAILTENLFHTNPEDCANLQTDSTQSLLIKLHIDSICDYVRIHFPSSFKL